MSELEIPQTMHVEETHDEPEGERQLTPREITMNCDRGEARGAAPGRDGVGPHLR